MATTTRLAIKQRMLRALRSRDPAVANLPVPIATTAGSADTTSLRSTTLERGNPPASRYNGRYVEIAETETGSPAVGEVAVVNDGGYDGTDKLTTSPAFSDSPNTAIDFHLYPEGFSPDIVNEAINNILEATYAPHVYIPSLITDADFDSNTLSATSWPAVGSPSTREFSVAEADIFTTDLVQVYLGERALRIITAANGDGVRSAAFDATEGERLLLSVVVHADSVEGVTVYLRDVTGSTDLDSVVIDQFAFTEARLFGTVPVGTKQMSVRFHGETHPATFIISPPVIVQSNISRLYTLPSWFQSEAYFEEAFYIPQGYPSEIADSYIALSEKWRSAPRPEFVRGDRFLTQHAVRLPPCYDNPIGLLCHRSFPTVSSDSTSIGLDRDYVAFKAIARVLRERNDASFVQFERDADAIARSLEYNQQRVTIEPPALVRR